MSVAAQSGPSGQEPVKSNARKDPSRGEQAIDAFQHADRIDAQPRVKFGDDMVYRQEAKR